MLQEDLKLQKESLNISSFSLSVYFCISASHTSMFPYPVPYGKSLIAGIGMGGLPLFSRQVRCSTTEAPVHTVPGIPGSMWEQGLACPWLLPSTRWWSWFPAWLSVGFTTLGCLRIFGLSGKYHPWDTSKSWNDQTCSHR